MRKPPSIFSIWFFAGGSIWFLVYILDDIRAHNFGTFFLLDLTAFSVFFLLMLAFIWKKSRYFESKEKQTP